MERAVDKKFIPMSDEIGNRQKGKNLGNSRSANKYRHGGATRAVKLSPARKWIRLLAEGGKTNSQDGATSVTSVTKRPGVDRDIKDRKEPVGDRGK